MDDKRIQLLSDDVYHYIFNMLEGEMLLDEMDALEKGAIASLCSQIFQAKLQGFFKSDRIRK